MSAEVSNTDCLLAQEYAESVLIDVVQISDVLLSVLAVVLLVVCIRTIKRSKTVIHFNFKLILSNAGVLLFLHAVSLLTIHARNQVMYRIYTDPCQLMMPTWVVVAIRMPQYFYTLAMLGVHLCLCLERAIATFYVSTYEAMGRWLGWLFVAVIWLISCVTNAYVFCREEWTAPKIYPGVTSTVNASTVLNMHYFALVFDLMTTAADVTLYYINKKQKNRVIHAADYTLSRSYQLRENKFAVRTLVLLSMCHSLIFLIYVTSHVIVRQIGKDWNRVLFTGALEGFYMLVPLHGCVSAAFFTYLISKKPVNQTIHVGAEGTHYFNQLKTQWGTTDPKLKAK